MKTITLSKVLLVDLSRQKSIIFSCLILPILIIISTWWVTADIPMIFDTITGDTIISTMVEVHVISGGLTAMGITAGLFSYIISTEYKQISNRLNQTGYSISTINSSILLTLFLVLVGTSIVATALSVSLSSPKYTMGIFIAIMMVTLIYAATGNFLSKLVPNTTAGSLIILIFSFMDLMLFSNPMGESLYLQQWTLFLPGFWPSQISYEAGFLGNSKNISTLAIYSVIYLVGMLVLTIILSVVNLTKGGRK